jgi:hypothetical protein
MHLINYYHISQIKVFFLFKSKIIELMFEERAILLSKINRHSQALSIYVHKLKKLDLAEKYCEDHKNDENDENKNIYIILIEMYLKPPNNQEPDIKNALLILQKHYEKLDPIKVNNYLI